jgi:single-strand DNA-binding protein
MANLNKVLLIGNLTKDPELRYTPGGTAVANLRMATNRTFKDKTGETRQEACFLTVVAWDKQAEVCNQYLHKGSPLFVEGRLQSRSWDGPDGKKRSVIEVRAERIQFLGSGPGGAKAAAPIDSSPAEKLPEDTTLASGAEDVPWGQDAAEDIS